MRRLPSLNGLRAFEAAARHESFTRAAEELAVTQGAVSHQVKALEAELGLRLFRRRPQGLALTEAGSGYLEVVRDALDRLAAGTERLRERSATGRLTVSTSPNFAAKWLVHRLGGFVSAHPEIDLRISANPQHVDFARDDVDLAVRHGEGRWPGLHAVRLYEEELFPVCSPALLEGAAAPEELLERHVLLHLDSRDDWSKWLGAAGLRADLARGPVFDQASMAIDAALDGQGIALGRTALVARDLIAARLVRPFERSLPVAYAYWIVTPAASAALPKIAGFRDWLLAEASAERARLAELPATPSGRSGRPWR